jgi:TPR repeat protein
MAFFGEWYSNVLNRISECRRCGLLVLTLGLLAVQPETATSLRPLGVPAKYQPLFVRYVDHRSLPEKMYNLVGFTSGDVGRSFALIAGVDTYPNLPQQDRSLVPASVDIQLLVRYLRDVESFDEVVVLRNGAVTDENFKYFLQSYFPERLKKFPRSRFLFAYSGHGIQDGSRGYLLQANATSFEDKANSISLKVLRTLYDEIVDSAYQSLALINACHSGDFTKRPFGARRQLLPKEPGAHVITAGGSRERAWHDPIVGAGSIFFEKFFAGLEGRADSQPIQPDGSRGDGIITVPELYDYLVAEVELATGQTQNPQVSDISRDGDEGSFFFFNRGKQVRAGLMHEWDPKRNFGPTQELAPDDIAAQAQEAIKAGRLEEAVEGFKKACDSGSTRGCAGIDLYYRGLGGFFVNPKMAVELYRKACSDGDAEACTQFGRAYELGKGGLAVDYNMALQLYGQACDGGSGDGCTALSAHYSLASDPKKSIELSRKADELFRKACDSGDMKSCGTLGSMYEPDGDRLTADPKLAVSLYRKACNGGHANGCYRLGQLEADPKVRLEFYQRACDMGDGLVCRDLGDAYRTGKFFGGPSLKIQPNLRTANELYRKACEKAHGFTCLDLGVAYHDGNPDWGLGADKKMAVEFFRIACNGEQNEGCFHLALAYDKGEGGLAADPRFAIQLFEETCRRGASKSCRSLGEAYRDGKGGLAPNDNLTVSLFSRACKKGDAQACVDLGDAYRSGVLGLAVDLKQTIDLYRNACDWQGLRCRVLAVAYEKGQLGLKPDRKMADTFYARACVEGDSESCTKKSRKQVKK